MKRAQGEEVKRPAHSVVLSEHVGQNWCVVGGCDDDDG